MAIESFSDITRSGQSAFVGGGAGAGVLVALVDFGVFGAPSKFFDVAVAGVVAGQKIVAAASLDMPVGVAQDELEFDPIVASACALGANSVRLLVASITGTNLRGQRNINLYAG